MLSFSVPKPNESVKLMCGQGVSVGKNLLSRDAIEEDSGSSGAIVPPLRREPL